MIILNLTGLMAVPNVFHCGRVKQLSPSRIRSPCLWKLWGRSLLSSSVHPSPPFSTSSRSICSSLWKGACPLLFFDCRGGWRWAINKHKRSLLKFCCLLNVNPIFSFITWRQTISQTLSEDTIVLRDGRSTWDRQDGKMGRRTVLAESFNKRRFKSRHLFDCKSRL